MSKTKIKNIDLIFSFLGGLILLFIIAPLVGLFLHSRFPEIKNTLADNEVISSIWLTLAISMISTLVFAAGAIPLAYLLARKKFIFKSLINGLIDLPVVIPHSAAGIAILTVIVPESFIGSVAASNGITLAGSELAIGLAMAFVSLPFLINAARNGFEGVPVRLENAALSLGASPFRVFVTISLPLAWRNILSGLVMMFARGMSEFGAVIIVAYHPMVTPVLIFERFNNFGLKYAIPAAVIFMSVSLIIFIIIRLLTPKKDASDI